MAKGISLHIGVDFVDVDHYGDENRLVGCINDATVMQRVADNMGFDSTLIIDEQATTRNLVKQLKQASDNLEAGDTFLISYSGHGGQVPDFSGDDEGDDETLCLFDRQYRDDELNRQLARFAEGVTIIWVSDSCHAENNYRSLTGEPQEAEFPLVKSIGVDASVRVVKLNKNSYQDWMSNGDFLKRSTPKISATLIQLAACKEKQLSRAAAEGEIDPLSVFTRHLVNVWDDGSFEGTYQELISEVGGLVPDEFDQTPQLVYGGKENITLMNKKPFLI